MSEPSEKDEFGDSCYCPRVRAAGTLKSLNESRFRIHALYVTLNSGIFSGMIILLASLNGDMWVPKWMVLLIILFGTVLGTWLSEVLWYGAIKFDRQRTKVLATILSKTDEIMREEYKLMKEIQKTRGSINDDLLLPQTFVVAHLLMFALTSCLLIWLLYW